VTGSDVVDTEAGRGHTVETWRFPGADGEPLTATAHLPAGSGPFPAVLAGHGLGSDRTAPYISGAGKAWAPDGLGVVAVDFPFHGERGPAPPGPGGLLGAGMYAATAVADLRALTGAAATHPSVDGARLGYLGFSMGAVLGVRFVAQEHLVRAAVFAVGGDPVTALAGRVPGLGAMAGSLLAAVDPRPYAAAIAPRPVLMLNAADDEIFDRAAAEALFDAFAEPKRLVFLPGTHAVWRRTAEWYATMREFFDRAL
jgi:dienelactone hydrolase